MSSVSAKQIEQPKESRIKFAVMTNEMTAAKSTLYQASQFEPYNPAQLYQKKGNYDLYDKMREDDQIRAVMDFKKSIILGSGWYIDSPDKKIKDFWENSLKINFAGEDEKTFTNSLYEGLSCLEYGFSISEIIFASEIVEGDSSPKWILKDLKTRAPHSFEIHMDDYGKITKVLQNQMNGNMVEIPPEKLLIFTYQNEFGNVYGRSEFSIGVYRSWWSKDNLIKFWNIALERNGMPLTIGVYPENADDDAITAFETILKNIQAKTSIVMSEGWSVDYKTVSAVGEAFDKAIDKHNLMIARGILIPDLMGLSGAQTSSGGLGGNTASTQISVFFELAKKINQEYAALLNKRIIYPLTKFNFGKDAIAELKFRELTKDKQFESLTKFLEYMGKQGSISDEQKLWFMDILGAPTEEMGKLLEEEKKKKEELAKNPPPPLPIVTPIPGKGNPLPMVNNPELPKKTAKEKPGEKSEKFSLKLSRDLNRYERKVNFAQINDDLNKLTETHIPAVANTIKIIINNLIEYIQQKKIVENKRIDRVNDLELKGMGELKTNILEAMKSAYNSGKISAIPDKKYGLAVTNPALDNADIAEWLKQTSLYTTTEEGQRLLKIAKGTLMDAIRSGAGVKETIKMLDEQFDDWDETVGAPRIENIIRTNTLKAFNQARANEFAKSADFISAYQYSAVLDDRTTDLCSSLDGKIFNPSEIDYYNPPNHYQCRSILVPIFKDEVDENFELSDMPSTDREQGGFLKLK